MADLVTAPTSAPGAVLPARRRVLPYRIYRIWGWYRGRVRLLYIGYTGQYPIDRLLQHREVQQWARDITSWQVDVSLPDVWDLGEIRQIEAALIRAERPIRNWECNEGNPERDWLPPRSPLPEEDGPVLLHTPSFGRLLAARVRAVSLWPGTPWLVGGGGVFGGVWLAWTWVLGQLGFDLPGAWDVAVAAAAAGAALLVRWLRPRARARRSRRRSRRRRR